MPKAARVEPPSVRGTHERKLGNIVLRTYRRSLDLNEIEPNPLQPRTGPKIDARLQRQIEANEGVFEPLLVEPHPEKEQMFRIIDGERRWTNCGELVAGGKEQYRILPTEVVDRTLTDDERLRVWVYIHRQRKEWSARDKENVAQQLVRHVGRQQQQTFSAHQSEKLTNLLIRTRCQAGSSNYEIHPQQLPGRENCKASLRNC